VILPPSQAERQMHADSRRSENSSSNSLFRPGFWQTSERQILFLLFWPAFFRPPSRRVITSPVARPPLSRAFNRSKRLRLFIQRSTRHFTRPAISFSRSTRQFFRPAISPLTRHFFRRTSSERSTITLPNLPFA